MKKTHKSFLPFKELDEEKDIAWNMRNVNPQVMEGIKMGESIPDIKKRFVDIVGSNKAAAERTARTIITSAENKARQDSYEQMEKDGVIMKKRWIAAHDARTRDWHAELDAQMVDVGDSFHNSYGEIEYPGDPHAHPANVYNCRCTMATKIIGFKKTGNAKNSLTNAGDSSTMEIDKAFDRKARPYDNDEDLKAVNPNYSTGKWEWRNNCQRCVPTYEMRRRGYKVTAKSIPSTNDDLYRNYLLAWENRDRIFCINGNGKKRF